jgi:hypothetical protein
MPRRLYIVGALVLFAQAGCHSMSGYGPAAQQITTPPTAVVLPPDGSPAVVVPGSQAVLPPGAVVPGTDTPIVGSTIVPQSALVLPPSDRDFVFDQIVDVVDDYFEIDHEERLKVVGTEPVEGRIDTFPLTGATLLEPWRRDSVGFYERLESTLQSIRRTANVRIIPNATGAPGYLVDVAVWKELEDVPQPIQASAGAATFRYDTSLQRDTEFDTDPNRIPGDPARPNGPRTPTIGWIPLGRDPNLEQAIIGKIQARLGGVMTAPVATVSAGPTIVAPSAASPQSVPPGVIVLPPPSGQLQELPPPR